MKSFLKPAPETEADSSTHIGSPLPSAFTDLSSKALSDTGPTLSGQDLAIRKLPASGRRPGEKGADKIPQPSDYVQTSFAWMRRGASVPSFVGLPNLMPEIAVSALTMAKGRAANRFNLAWRYFSWRKLFNFFRIEAQLSMGVTKVRGYPYEWEIDTTNICQLKCPLCHTGLGNIKRLKGMMHFDTFKKTVDEVKGYVIWLSLYSWGEPLLNKQLPRFLKYAHDARIATIISSNLSLKLTPERAEELIKSGLDVMIISLDGVTQEVYERYRVRGKLDLVLDNLRLLVQKKRELKSKTPYLEWQFIVMKQNEHQIPEARKMAKELGVDQIIFKKVDFPHGIGTPEMAEKWQPVNTPEFWRNTPLAKPYNENGVRCWKLWRSGVVNWDGGCAPCCYLTDAKDDFGNVKDNSVKEIWNNVYYTTARGLFKNGDMPKVEVGCLTCDVYLESPNGRKHSASILKKLAESRQTETRKNNQLVVLDSTPEARGQTPDGEKADY